MAPDLKIRKKHKCLQVSKTIESFSTTGTKTYLGLMKVKLQLLDFLSAFPRVLYCGDGHQVAALVTWKGDVPSLAVWGSLQPIFRAKSSQKYHQQFCW